MQWGNAGHPPPILVREHRVAQRLVAPTALPVGLGGSESRVSELGPVPMDRVLCFTDGVVEEHRSGGEQFGEDQLIDCVNSWRGRAAASGR
ncbi:SpoIIE family protein phosphatase [Streptomyces bottropensis]|uniref:SpoIIE family protein phosphatase n=1 Tax=Streptomyces bottropensis TaxID=42235 RepID=UPI0037A1842E